MPAVFSPDVGGLGVEEQLVQPDNAATATAHTNALINTRFFINAL